MRALVISGGGSKGAFAGGVAQYLLEEKKLAYDLFLGTSTGSLLISHLALREIAEGHITPTILEEPEVLLTHNPKVPGLDGQKMSKSYGNTIGLREDPDDVARKLKTTIRALQRMVVSVR